MNEPVEPTLQDLENADLRRRVRRLELLLGRLLEDSSTFLMIPVWQSEFLMGSGLPPFMEPPDPDQNRLDSAGWK